MQKNLLSYLLGIVALTFVCSCGTVKKDEVKVDVKGIEQADKKDNKEVAQADAQPVAGTVVAQNEETDPSKSVKQEEDTPKAQDEEAKAQEEEPKAQEENKA